MPTTRIHEGESFRTRPVYATPPAPRAWYIAVVRERAPSPPPILRVLGIDPGTRKLGWGVVERRGAKLAPIAAGVVALPAREPLATRLAQAFDAIEAILEDHAPTVVAVESVFYARFPSATIQLAHVRGVALLVAERRGLAIAEYAPALVKRTVAGRGAAEKVQVARVVAATLGLRSPPPADAADALAIAITHLSSAAFASRAR
jgi:crossover junction endodeoxyribonuclease RuvC